MLLPEPVQNLIDAFVRLPGIGPKSASRLVFYLLNAPEQISLDLGEALSELRANITYCRQCFNITRKGEELCEVCREGERNQKLLCVVEEPLDVFALERTGGFNGLYHVLHGVLSPIEGVGVDDLRIKELLERCEGGQVAEVILATNPTMEGEATALYISRRLEGKGVRVTRLARGLPVGGDLEYADQYTLRRALEGRQEMD